MSWKPSRLAAVLLAALPSLAWAHHFMGGQVPRTPLQGLLSGLGHPVIGMDHFAFIVAAGFLLALLPRGLWGVLALVVGALAGAAVHLAGATLPAGEALVAASVVLIGVLVMQGRAWPLAALAAFLAVAGALHGYAYAESIFGAERAPLGAYLVGFSLVQLVIASAAFLAHRKLRAEMKRRVALAVGGAAGLIGVLALTFA